MKQFICITYGIFSLFFALGQSDTLNTSVMTDQEIENHFFGRTRLEFRIARDKSILNQDIKASFTSLQLGIKFNTHYKAGLSLFFMDPVSVSPNWNSTVNYYWLKFDGFGAYFEYILLKNYRFEVSAPISISRVKGFAEAFDENKEPLVSRDTSTTPFPVMSFGAYGAYSINYWLALGLGVGYRFPFSENTTQNEVLSTPFYSLGIKFQIGKLYTTLAHHEKVLHLKSIYFRERKPAKSTDLMNRANAIYLKKQKRQLKKNKEQ